MKILAIRLKNLASMEGVTEIDFTKEPLCSAGIFAITGPTGAGKSTILDALCLALYAKTPRYAQGKESGIEVNELNQGDVRGILRNGTGDGYAEVDFIGIDNKKYSARWAVKRARNKAEGAIQKDTLTLKDINSGLVITDMKMEACREIERLVGLSFEQFTRSVLLAQGDFTAFLKADNNDKASLLEKLTGTNIYSRISQQVFTNYKAAQSAVEHLRLVLDNVAVMTAEEIEDETQKQVDSTNLLIEIQKQLEQVDREIGWQERMMVLQTQKQTAMAALETAQKQKQDAAEPAAKLKLVEEAQKIRTTFELHQSLEQEYSAETTKLELAQNELKQFEHAMAQVEQCIASHSKTMNDAIEIRSKTLPLISEARSLDLQLAGQEKNVRSCERAWFEARERTEEKEAELAKLKYSLQEVDNTIKSLNDWKQKNLDREPIAINIQFIRTRLEEASRLLKNAAAISVQVEGRNTEVKQSEQILVQTTTDIAAKQIAVQELRDEQEKLQLRLDAFSFASLEGARRENEIRLHELITAQASWIVLYDKRKALHSAELDLKAIKNEARNQQDRLKTIEVLIPSAFEKKNSSEQRLARATLELSENVESLRTQLTDGQACPVCGSLEHPYTRHHPQVSTLMTMLENEANDDSEKYAALVQEKQGLIDSIKKLSIQDERLESNCKEITTLLTKLEQDWKTFQLETVPIVESEVTEWLEAQIKQHRLAQQQVIQQINEHASIEVELKKNQTRFLALEKEYNAAKHLYIIESGKLDSLNQRLQELQVEHQHKEAEISNLTTGLNGYFPQASWYRNWKEAPSDFIGRLETFEVEWKDKQAALDSNVGNRQLIEHSVGQLTGQLNDQHAITEKQKKELDSASAIYQDLIAGRKKLFDGKLIADVESELQGNIQHAITILEEAKHEKQTLLQKIAVSNSVIDQLLKSINNKQTATAELMQKLNDWLGRINASRQHLLDVAELKELLAHSHDWIEEQQRRLKLLDRAIIEAGANLRERETEIELHNKLGNAPRAVEHLFLEKETLRSEKAKQDELLIQSKFRLNADAANKKRAGKIIQDIEKASIVADNWSKLNEMIGSADGKKFRQVAQEYTLDVMLSFANQHLNGLNKRYQLKRIENTLGLLVLDKDMGDEERTVVSLSGGESFLVSLALALGLASLSSTRMKVESLFIDEGFGSLDPATLNIAMDALERLYNQGRKVGIISHVQEMQERISTQIKVVKQSTGKSVVMVEG